MIKLIIISAAFCALQAGHVYADQGNAKTAAAEWSA